MTPAEAAAWALQVSKWRFPTRPNPNNLARMLGFEIARMPSSSRDIDGMCLATSEGGIILVNPQRPWVRRQWTIAHEIGHLLLHKSSWTQGGQAPLACWEAHRAGKASTQWEREADRFATMFLMPDVLVDYWYTEYGCDVEKVAFVLGVSKQALLLRLRELGRLRNATGPLAGGR